MFAHRINEQGFELAGTFGVLDAPADDTAAEDIEDDIEIEVGPFHWSHQLGNVPRRDLVWGFDQQFRLLINGMATLPAALGNLSLSGQDAIHRTDRAEVGAFIEQSSKDLCGRLIGEAGRAQMGRHLNPFNFRQGTR